MDAEGASASVASEQDALTLSRVCRTFSGQREFPNGLVLS
jgi:hypothetical protein